MKRMILGTVQLGIEYGIHNSVGKPSTEKAFEILDYAFNSGICCLDTANAYGDSEEIIGEYIKKTGNIFSVCTKLPIKMQEQNIEEYYYETINKLGISYLEILYLHRFEQCKDEKLLEEIMKFKKNGYIKKIGISIYEPEEFHYILEHLSGVVDVVQIPFNMLDNTRWMKDELFRRARERKIEIFVRSIYLQGLFFMDSNSKKVKQLEVSKQIEQLNVLAQKRKCSMGQLAIDFVNTIDEIDAFLVGCETIEQIQENIIIHNNSTALKDTELEEIFVIGTKASDISIDPRRWGDI